MTIPHPTRRTLVLGALLAAFVVLTTPTPIRASAGGVNAITYSGQATALRAMIPGSSFMVADTGPLPPEGGGRETGILDASVPGTLQANTVHAATVAQNGRSRSEASMADLSLDVAGVVIGAEFVSASAEAMWIDDDCLVKGSSEIVGLTVDGLPVVVTGEPNQTIPLLFGNVVVNEQVEQHIGDACSMTVNALRVMVPGVADVVVSSAYVDIDGGKVHCGRDDFATGGGWITGTPSGDRATFGVAGGDFRKDGLWGHLAYVDHGTGMRVLGTEVLTYEDVDETTRRIRGTCEVNGFPGFTYEVEVSDDGEPGGADAFTLRLSDGYEAGGTLAGGNVRLHPACK